MKSPGLIAAIGILMVGAAGCGGPASPVIVVGDFANPPFSSWSEAHEPVGIEVEILDLVGRELGRPVEWRELPFVEMLPAVENGTAHVAASTIGITAERAERVRFSEPYHLTEISVIVRAGGSEPRSITELGGLPVGAGRATTSEDAVRRSMPEAVLVLDREGEMTFAEMLLAGKIAALVMDRPAAERTVSDSSGKMAVLEGHLGVERYAFAVNPDEEEILSAIDDVIRSLRSEGRLEAWLNEP